MKRKLDLINVWKLKSSKSTQTWYNLHLHQYLSFEPNFGSFGLDGNFMKIEAKQSLNRSVMLNNVWKLKSSKSIQTWYNLHLDQCLSFEPNFDSFGLDEKFVKIEAKQSWNWSVMLKIVWKLKSSKSTQTWYNLHLHQYLSFEPNFGSFGLDENFVKLEAKRSWKWSVML